MIISWNTRGASFLFLKVRIAKNEMKHKKGYPELNLMVKVESVYFSTFPDIFNAIVKCGSMFNVNKAFC